MKKRLVSIIIPVYNEERRLAVCLESIKGQKHRDFTTELIVVDDGSTDNTLKVAKEYGARIYKNGTHNIERGKSIGFQHARGEYIFFIDADNALTTKDSLSIAVAILEKHSNVFSVQWWRFKYHSNHSLVNRYCELFGVNDPFIFYFKKRGLLTQTETSWPYPQTVVKNFKNYVVTHYSDDLPTLGSQGYLVRAESLKKSHWKPYLFHLDSVADLVKQEAGDIALLKRDIAHFYANSLQSMVKKLRRNIILFWKYRNLRRYSYTMPLYRLMYISLLMGTLLVPFIHALKGYRKKPDIAWLLHPVICFIVVWLYAFSTVEYQFIRNEER